MPRLITQYSALRRSEYKYCEISSLIPEPITSGGSHEMDAQRDCVSRLARHLVHAVLNNRGRGNAFGDQFDRSQRAILSNN
jgi:hypothetical protein